MFLGHWELATHGACYWYVNEAGFIRPIVRATAGPAQICLESESVGWNGGRGRLFFRVIGLEPHLTSNVSGTKECTFKSKQLTHAYKT